MQSEWAGSFIMMVRQDEEQKDSPSAVRSLVDRARAGETNAFEQILVLYQRQVMGTAARLLGNIDDARDAAQEVFLRLHKYLDRFDEEKDFLPWLYRMTVNVCKDIARKRRSAITTSLEQEQESGGLDYLTTYPDIEAKIGTAQERRIISEALDTLSDKERAAIVLRDIEGLDTKEVAQLLGSSESTVRSQICMARIKIKKYRDKVFKKS
jgi:RNA polymerase sigma-70 factor, ECF subfamily